MTLLEASDYLRKFAYPRMELGLLFANVTKKTLMGWDSLVARAVLGVHHVSNVSGVAHSALYMALGIPPLSSYALVVAGTELGVSLRDVPAAMHSLTTRSRLHAAIASRHLTTAGQDVGGVRWLVVRGARECRVNRVARVLCRLLKGGTRGQSRLQCPFVEITPLPRCPLWTCGWDVRYSPPVCRPWTAIPYALRYPAAAARCLPSRTVPFARDMVATLPSSAFPSPMVDLGSSTDLAPVWSFRVGLLRLVPTSLLKLLLSLCPCGPSL